MRHAVLIGGLVLAAAWIAVGQESEPQAQTLEERVAALEGRMDKLEDKWFRFRTKRRQWALRKDRLEAWGKLELGMPRNQAAMILAPVVEWQALKRKGRKDSPDWGRFIFDDGYVDIRDGRVQWWHREVP